MNYRLNLDADLVPGLLFEFLAAQSSSKTLCLWRVADVTLKILTKAMLLRTSFL